MKRGFQTETHVVVYCDYCGDIYVDGDGESICFDTTNQAAEFLSYDSSTGWAYDGDTIRCDSCLVSDECRADGHDFILTVYPSPLPIVTECSRCGLLEPEQEK
ncbi:hypothetical protein ACWF9G_19705 [Nocardia sp. NPDC055029]